jgi:hypothetical protein
MTTINKTHKRNGAMISMYPIQLKTPIEYPSRNTPHRFKRRQETTMISTDNTDAIKFVKI